MRLKTTAAVGILAAGSLLLAAACSSSSGTASSTTSAAASSEASSAAVRRWQRRCRDHRQGRRHPAGHHHLDRWETRIDLRWRRFQGRRVDYDIQNANGDKAKMANIADSMVANGVTVLAIVPWTVSPERQFRRRPRRRCADHRLRPFDLGGSAATTCRSTIRRSASCR